MTASIDGTYRRRPSEKRRVPDTAQVASGFLDDERRGVLSVTSIRHPEASSKRRIGSTPAARPQSCALMLRVWSYGSVSERDDLLELVSDVYGRLPTMSANVHSWMHMERNEWAMELARQRFQSGPVSGLSGHHRSGPSEYEGWERLVIDPRRARSVLSTETPGTDSRSDLRRRNDLDEQLPGRHYCLPDLDREVPSRRRDLLDPSWLVDFDCTNYVLDLHNVRDVLRMRTELSSAEVVVQRRLSLYATDVEVLIDARARLPASTDSVRRRSAVPEVELQDVHLDRPVDESTFRIDEVQSPRHRRRRTEPRLAARQQFPDDLWPADPPAEVPPAAAVEVATVALSVLTAASGALLPGRGSISVYTPRPTGSAAGVLGTTSSRWPGIARPANRYQRSPFRAQSGRSQ